MIILSIFSLVAYQCTFHDGFQSSPQGYFFHLFYYRSTNCADSYVDWSIFGLENSLHLNEIIHMPDQNSLVSRTFKLTVIQLVISSLFVATSVVVIGKLQLGMIIKFRVVNCHNFR